MPEGHNFTILSGITKIAKATLQSIKYFMQGALMFYSKANTPYKTDIELNSGNIKVQQCRYILLGCRGGLGYHCLELNVSITQEQLDSYHGSRHTHWWVERFCTEGDPYVHVYSCWSLFSYLRLMGGDN